MFWLAKFFKGGKTLSQGIKEFFKINGRMPNAHETLRMKIFSGNRNRMSFNFQKTELLIGGNQDLEKRRKRSLKKNLRYRMFLKVKRSKTHKAELGSLINLNGNLKMLL